ncbi:MAG: PorT family protein [Fibromonadaceae bacterium]|jgi:hypothetical protein|nr:PorT family protein [Fibromonadaceae bacterium]
MKKLAFIVAVLALGTFAQEQEKSKEENANDGIALGIRGGVHIMSMGTFDLSVGWHLGAVRDVMKLADLEMFGSIYLQPGVLFFTKNSWFDTKTYWIEFPILASWKHNRYRVNIGPYVNLGLLGDFEDKAATAISGQREESMNRFDLGLSFGTSYELWRFWLGASYNYGFIKVSDYHDSGSASYRLTLGFNL